MSVINLTPLLDLCQGKIVDQYIIFETARINIVVMPDERYNPKCSRCGLICKSVHSYVDRDIRDMNVYNFKTYRLC